MSVANGSQFKSLTDASYPRNKSKVFPSKCIEVIPTFSKFWHFVVFEKSFALIHPPFPIFSHKSWKIQFIILGLGMQRTKDKPCPQLGRD